MRKARIGICPEGLPVIGITAFSTLIFAILDWWIPTLLFWILCLFSVHFFRDPARVIPAAPDLAVSPADGTVIKIESRKDPFCGENRQCISIFMSVFNVHVNRAPVSCEVNGIKYFPGRFFNASFDKASTDNERCAWHLKSADANWTMVQIAGLIARRIVCRAQEGDHLSRGQRLGMIRFGSRVDLYLPASYTPTVKIGDKVFGGQSVIAHKQDTPKAA